ncbi:MAG: EcsC family protein [Chryseolinea sp.]
MDEYAKMTSIEVSEWKNRMEADPSFSNALAKRLQVRINKIIPEKLHVAITGAIKQMIRAVCFGVGFTTKEAATGMLLEEVEKKVDEKIIFYARTAAAEGAATGAAGILVGLADFPLWLTLKMKMLFELAALYGYNAKDYKERLFLLYIFELTFSSQENRQKIFRVVEHWDDYAQTLPENMDEFDWRTFQQEYRDYIDIAKLLQLVPGIGAVVGALVNLRLTKKLGRTAKNAYRLRALSLQGD